MGVRIQKILYIISIFLMSGILLLAGSIIGMQNERARLIQQEQAEVVTDIAIVNLDEGIYEEGKKTYYSTILMDLEADNLISENLEAARQGILNGSYAAYILIPSEFSQNAASINTVPQKAVLEFAINPNLREDVSRLTMSNVKNFEISLNTNMSYMYVQALLAEFHNAQDLSGTILKNDTYEMERLGAIDSNSLLVTPDYEEIEKIEPEIEEIDFKETFEKNGETLDSVYDNYESFIKEGEEAFAEIKEKEEYIVDEVDAFYEIVSELDISSDEDGNSVYEAGLEALKTYLADYDVQYEKQKKLVADIITMLSKGEQDSEDDSELGESSEIIENEDGFEFDADIKPISEIVKENIQNSLAIANNLISAGNESNNEKISEMQVVVAELKTIVLGDSGTNGDTLYIGLDTDSVPETYSEPDIDSNAVLEKLNQLEAKLNQFQEIPTINVEDVYSDEVALEPFEKLIDEVEKIPKVDSREYRVIFEEQVLAPLNEEIASENLKVQEAGNAMLTPLEEYMAELIEFDLYSFYDYEAMDELMTDFGDNIFLLEDQILETHGEYEDFVYDTVDLTNETLITMQAELEEAYENTADNVYKEVALAKEHRETMNKFNTDILGSFQKKLPYTRIGQLEYVQAYDFIVKPIKMSDASITKDKTLIWQDSDALRNILLSMIGLLCFFVCSLMFIRMQNFADDAQDIG